MRRVYLRLQLVLLLTAGATLSQDSSELVRLGTAALKNDKFDEAVKDLQRAVSLNPTDIEAHMALGDAWKTIYLRGSGLTFEEANRSESEYQIVLKYDAGNITALEALGDLEMTKAMKTQDADKKAGAYDQALSCCQKLESIDPGNKRGHFCLGEITRDRVSTAISDARKRSQMNPDEPGPLRDSQLRQELKGKYGLSMREAIIEFEKVLAIDPKDSEAMIGLATIYRARSDLSETSEEYQRDIADCQRWLQKAFTSQPPRTYVSEDVQRRKLLTKVDPVYPPLAETARVQGAVRFEITIGEDGQVIDVHLIRGHPLLISAAEAAVKQWGYQPTLVNGQPAEVVTTVDVNFVLPAAH